MARRYTLAGRHDDARRHWEEIARHAGESPHTRFLLVGYREADPAVAAAALEDAAREETVYRTAAEGVAEGLLRAGRRDEAAALYGLLAAQARPGSTRGHWRGPADQKAESYLRVGRLLAARGVAWVAMDYPLGRLENFGPLTAAHPSPILVENRAAFEEKGVALFKDRFAGTFGHCTPEGNRRIAVEAAKAVRQAAARRARGG